MKIKTVKLANFRSYKNETTINFNNLNVFVGKNDIGKSTILEALDIFFNESRGVVKIDKEDLNKQAQSEGETEIKISVVFDGFPSYLTIDSTNFTNLEEEYLLTQDGYLEIVKRGRSRVLWDPLQLRKKGWDNSPAPNKKYSDDCIVYRGNLSAIPRVVWTMERV